VTRNRLPPRAVARLDELLAPSKPRRILFFSKRKAHTRVASHLIRGFRSQGHRVLWLRPSRLGKLLGRDLGEALVRRRGLAFRPDLILVYKHDVSPELLSSLPSALPRVVYYEDLPPDPSAPGERLLEVARRSSVLFTTGSLAPPTCAGAAIRSTTRGVDGAGRSKQTPPSSVWPSARSASS
jgi:hypothetical protein